MGGEVYRLILIEQGFKMADLFENNFKKLPAEIESLICLSLKQFQNIKHSTHYLT